MIVNSSKNITSAECHCLTCTNSCWTIILLSGKFWSTDTVLKKENAWFFCFDFKDLEEENDENFDKKNFILNKKQSRHLSMEINESMLGSIKSNSNRDSSESTKKTKVFADSNDGLIELIEQLSKDPDLIKLINGINEISGQRNINPFNQYDIDIVLRANDLDKFVNAKKMESDFAVVLNCKLVE